MNVSNQKVIIIELGEVEKIELSTGRVMNMYGEPKKFLFDSNSPMRFGEVVDPFTEKPLLIKCSARGNPNQPHPKILI